MKLHATVVMPATILQNMRIVRIAYSAINGKLFINNRI